MSHDPASDRPEVVRRDVGGWISGPCLPVCTRCGELKVDDGNDMHPECEDAEAADARAALKGAEPVKADDVRVGDLLLLPGVEARVTAVHHGEHYVNGALVHNAVAIDWRAGSARGVMFRRRVELLDRLPRRPERGDRS